MKTNRVAVPAIDNFGTGARTAGGGPNRTRIGALIAAAENHLARRRLVDGSNKDVHGAIDEAARAIHDDHGAVVEVGDALSR